MKHQPLTLDTIPSITPSQLHILRRLGIVSLADLLSFTPVRQARAVRAWRDGLIRKSEVSVYLHPDARSQSPEAILRGSHEALAAASTAVTKELRDLGLHTVADVASYAAFEEAELAVLSTSPTQDAQTDPSGPTCVIPTCRQFTRNTKRYVSFFKQVELRGLSISLLTWQLNKEVAIISA